MESLDSISDDYSESSFEDSAGTSSSSIDMVEDDASSSSSSSFGPLYELSELMAQLPIKRGLSKYYKGKSESFGCLGSAKSLEDLTKIGNSYNKRMKSCKSLGGRRSSFGPKAGITKQSSRKPTLSSLTHTNTLVDTCTSSFSLDKNF
ncbi:protein OXIDATIVE STRESS 3-like isoform X1 [Lycium ferocissimum]|uniref:protein OXIDATIVE STRESS 3-like isoform X1 n=1 Tax=Lycium ferocissimum TaxID=112874 RepID=UPI00281534A9|nr:protein OXIDATIVE STRESS 3-like isoform X1 [Lycium ferocissimum]